MEGICSFLLPSSSASERSEDAGKATKATSTLSRSPESKLTQMHLDFGQRDFDGTVCGECGMFYCPGTAQDELLHSRYHRQYQQHLYFGQLKKVVPVSEDREYSIIRCDEESYKSSVALKKKAHFLRQVVDQELGSPPEVSAAHSPVTYIMIEKSTMKAVGCVIVEKIDHAYRLCSRTSSSSPSHTSDSETLKEMGGTSHFN
tara:strand:+ start:1135 stop:1740 length:606 start_codon:yes stop_codon:yes gene_type:complete